MSVYYAKTTLYPVSTGNAIVVLLNESDAWENGIRDTDKVSIKIDGKKEIVANVNLTKKKIKVGHIGVLPNMWDKYKFKEGEVARISFTDVNPESMIALKKKILGKPLNYKEIHSIIKDIADGRFSDTLSTYYVASSFIYKATDLELYHTTKAMAETGEMLKFKGLVADKHCIGGVPGNETTMVMVPLIASLGIKIPKTFSKAITSPAATGEDVNVIMDIEFTADQIKKLVKKNNSCLVWGGGLSLAPADDRIIRVSYPISMEPYSKIVISIMAKKVAMGINHLLIDIPVGKTAKVPDQKTALELKRKFEYVATKFGIKIHVEITKAIQPIGSGVGPALESRDVLRVLQQHPRRPKDLEEKVVLLSSKLIDLCGLAKGNEAKKLAKEQLKNGEAWKKMQDIIKAQGGYSKINSEDLVLGAVKQYIDAPKSGIISEIDMKLLNQVARAVGCPVSESTGVYLNRKVGEEVAKGDRLYTLYAKDKNRIKVALDLLKNKKLYYIK
ncbi:thymidine phosphorylase [Patescibacteria group bacterium]|nr:thymidine phosphorylase [Patescibacteria group bacterium]